VTLLLIVAIAGALGWYARRRSVLLVPVVAAFVYGAIVLGIGAGRDTPIVAVAILAEVGLAAGLTARHRSVRRA
jgi:hypothetical protein